MKKIVLATQNRNKFKEMTEVLQGSGWEFSPAWEFPGAPEVEEDGETLEVNSLKKAKTLCLFTGLPALSDDTGLFVDALGGRPGIFAARYAGVGCSYEDNVRKMLAEMAGVSWEKRQAKFRTVITIFYPDHPYHQVMGEVAGFITLQPRGGKGFGYDPIFQPEGQDRVFAEISLEEKNKISHRGKALQAALKIMNS
jgi:XTP/dITP diphosphohydrolase